MASAEKHKRRSCKSYKGSMSEFAGFARKVAIHNDGVKKTRSLREAFKNMFSGHKRNKADA